MWTLEQALTRGGLVLTFGAAACSSQLDLGHDTQAGSHGPATPSPLSGPDRPTRSSCVGIPCFAGPAVVMATSQGSAEGLAVDADHVFWAASAAQALMETPKDGSKTVSVATPEGGPLRVALDDTNVYFTSAVGGYVATTPKSTRPQISPVAGELVRLLVSGEPQPESLVVDSDVVYFADAAGTVKRVDVFGSDLQTIVTGLASGAELALDADFLYYADAAAGEIHAVDRASNADVRLAAGLAHPIAPVPRGQTLYFLERDSQTASSGNGRLLSMPRAGGPVTVLLPQLEAPSGLAADTAAVYVCTRGSAANGHRGRVLRLGDDGQISALAVDQADPFAIAVDGAGVYWTSEANNGLYWISR